MLVSNLHTLCWVLYLFSGILSDLNNEQKVTYNVTVYPFYGIDVYDTLNDLCNTHHPEQAPVWVSIGCRRAGDVI